MRGLAIGHACGDSTEFQPVADAVARSAAAALRQAGADPAAVGYLELSGGALASDNLVELDGLTRVYRDSRVAAGSVAANYGQLASAQGIVSVIKAALCLHRRQLPAAAALAAYPADVLRAAFGAAKTDAAWPAPADGLRLAAVNSLGLDRGYAHMILQEPSEANRQEAKTPALPAAAGRAWSPPCTLAASTPSPR